MRMLNMALSCLRVPWQQGANAPGAMLPPLASDAAGGLHGSEGGGGGGGAPMRQGKIGVESVYHVQVGGWVWWRVAGAPRSACSACSLASPRGLPSLFFELDSPHSCSPFTHKHMHSPTPLPPPMQAISIMEEAIVSGVLPSFKADSGVPIDLTQFPPAVAEVYALTVVSQLCV